MQQAQFAEHKGILVPAHVMAGGLFLVEHWRPEKSGKLKLLDVSPARNLVVNQGLNHILDAVLHGSAQVTTWYIGIFEGNYTPVAGDTAAGFPAAATESTAYAEATRVAYNEGAAASQSTTNSGSAAVFTINATKTMYGAFLSSASAKSATTGTLFAATKFAAARSVINADLLNITYTFNLTAS